MPTRLSQVMDAESADPSLHVHTVQASTVDDRSQSSTSMNTSTSVGVPVEPAATSQPGSNLNRYIYPQYG